MRLHEIQHQAIKSIIADIVAAKGRIWLFGSRVDDTKWGGDILEAIQRTHSHVEGMVKVKFQKMM